MDNQLSRLTSGQYRRLINPEQIMRSGRVLICPPPRPGGGPTNAMLRVAAQLKQQGVKTTTNMFSAWHVALLNVGVGIRFDALRLVRLGRRLVYRVDGYYSREILKYQGRLWQPGYERINRRITVALRTADFVIYQSHFSKRHLDTLYQRPAGTYDIILNGVDLNQFSPVEKDSSDLPTVGCIGTFRANRIEVLLDIIQRLPLRHRLLVVGRIDEQCRRDLEMFRSSRPTNCRVEYVPYVVGDVQLVKWYRQIDCFLHPIIGDTCSNAVVEALACGVPVIVPRFSGSSELVGSGGIIVEVDPWVNYDAFLEGYAEAVVSILNPCEHYAKRAREQALNQLDINNTSRKYASALSLRDLG